MKMEDAFKSLLQYAQLEQEWLGHKTDPSLTRRFRVKYQILEGVPTQIWLTRIRMAAIADAKRVKA